MKQDAGARWRDNILWTNSCDTYLCALLKNIVAILFFISILGQTFSRYILVLDYQINKDFIAKNLCENRNRPGIECAGKCYLCKRLKKEDKKDQENPERRAENKFEVVYFGLNHLINHPASIALSISYPEFREDGINGVTGACFHPPQC